MKGHLFSSLSFAFCTLISFPELYFYQCYIHIVKLTRNKKYRYNTNITQGNTSFRVVTKYPG